LAECVCDSEFKAHSEAWQARRQIEAANEAFDFLYSGLREAKQRFETGSDAGRDGVIHALETIVKFLGLYEPVLAGGLHAPPAMLLDALMNLDDGVVHQMLRKVKHSGRGRASAGRESFKGMVAFSVDGLCASGMIFKDAHESVARVLREEGVTPSRGSGEVDERTVRGWCEDVAADVGRHGEAAQTFDLLQKELEAETSAAPEIIRRRLLDRLAHVARVTRA
jgi:hypothetical protein